MAGVCLFRWNFHSIPGSWLPSIVLVLLEFKELLFAIIVVVFFLLTA